jgi:hypothetical protein
MVVGGDGGESNSSQHVHARSFQFVSERIFNSLFSCRVVAVHGVSLVLASLLASATIHSA